MTLHQNRDRGMASDGATLTPVRMDLEKHFWVSCKLAASFIETANGLLEFAFFCDEINQWSPHFMIKDCYELIERLVDIL